MHPNETPETAESPHGGTEDHIPDNATILRRLRQAFPDWAFVHDPGSGTWMALRGGEEDGITIQRADPLSLKLTVEAVRRGPR